MMIERNPAYRGMYLTFNTTEDCNLRCTYCYEINKTPRVLPLDYAKKFIDLILNDFSSTVEGEGEILGEGLILDFIGGDALMNVELVRQIMYYFIWTANIKNHHWANRWMMSISTNGTLFKNQEVRSFLDEFSGLLSLSVSVDGCPKSHDTCRVFTDGSGTSEAITANWPWYIDYCHRSNIEPQIKATLTKESIPYLFESLVYLHEELKLSKIDMNFITEDCGLTENDILEFDRQMELCTRYVLDRKDSMYWAMLDKFEIGHPFDETNKMNRRCGSGIMPTLGIDGNIYPCLRWLPHTVTQIDNIKDFILGNVNDGKLSNKKGFAAVRETTCWDMSDDECKKCEIQSTCAYCIAGCYSAFHEFKRTKFSCGIAKIQSKWAKYYWDTI